MAGASEATSKAWSVVLQFSCCSSTGAALSSATGSLLARVRGRLGQPSPLQSGLKDACLEQGASDGAWLQDCPKRGPGTVKGCDQGLAHTQFSAAWDLAGFSTDFANVSKFLFCSFESIAKKKKSTLDPGGLGGGGEKKPLYSFFSQLLK